MLLAGVVLKPVPVIVTVVPTEPEVGVKELSVGAEFVMLKDTAEKSNRTASFLVQLFGLPIDANKSDRVPLVIPE